MWKAGLTDYEEFAKRLLERITTHPISFEVFADDAAEMRRQALMIAEWGDNVYVKIPVSTTAGESMAPLVRELSESGVKVNVTAVFTSAQVELLTEAVKDGAPSYISVFAGRIADAGIDPVPLMARAVDIMVAGSALGADLGVTARDPQRRPGRSGWLPHHHRDARPAQEAGPARQGPRPVLARDRADVPPRRAGRRLFSVTEMNRVCVTGGAGFIGSTLADRLRADGAEVVIVDDFRTGRREFVADLLEDPAVTLYEGDVLDESLLRRAFEGCDWVFHLQANADVRHGLERTRQDLEQNTIATATVLEAMRAQGVSKIGFSSTGSVYGEPDVFPTPENAPFPLQTSLYGASKLAGEGMIAAYAHGFGFTGLIFRFVSILGERYTHGHVFDFYCALKRDPGRLRVLGNGRQEKSYLYVQDCVSAILTAARKHESRPGEAAVYNLGRDETVVVDDSVALITEHMGLSPEIEHSGGTRGWAGDSPLIHLDCSRIEALGWNPTLTIRESIVRTLEWFDANPYAWESVVASEAAAR